MKVHDIMTSPVTTVRTTDRVSDIARLLLDEGYSGVPVVDQEGRLAGIVTEADLVAKHARPHLPIYLGILGWVVPIETPHRTEEVRRVVALTAQDLMTEHVRTVDPDADIDDVATLMVDEGVNPVPVVEHLPDGPRLVGIVSRRDIIQLLVQEEEGADDSAPAS
jgi:CBS domain-containing protein